MSDQVNGQTCLSGIYVIHLMTNRFICFKSSRFVINYIILLENRRLKHLKLNQEKYGNDRLNGNLGLLRQAPYGVYTCSLFRGSLPRALLSQLAGFVALRRSALIHNAHSYPTTPALQPTIGPPQERTPPVLSYQGCAQSRQSLRAEERSHTDSRRIDILLTILL